MREMNEQLALFRPIYIQRTEDGQEILEQVACPPDEWTWTGTRESRLAIKDLPALYRWRVYGLPRGSIIYKVREGEK
jgi:hypothetical protein